MIQLNEQPKNNENQNKKTNLLCDLELDSIIKYFKKQWSWFSFAPLPPPFLFSSFTICPSWSQSDIFWQNRSAIHSCCPHSSSPWLQSVRWGCRTCGQALPTAPDVECSCGHLWWLCFSARTNKLCCFLVPCVAVFFCHFKIQVKQFAWILWHSKSRHVVFIKMF